MTADTKLRQLLSILLICFTLTSAEALQRGMNLLVVRLRIKLEEDLGPAKYLSSIVDFFQAMLEILTQL